MLIAAIWTSHETYQFGDIWPCVISLVTVQIHAGKKLWRVWISAFFFLLLSLCPSAFCKPFTDETFLSLINIICGGLFEASLYIPHISFWSSGISRKLASIPDFVSSKSNPRALNLSRIRPQNTATSVYSSPLLCLEWRSNFSTKSQFKPGLEARFWFDTMTLFDRSYFWELKRVLHWNLLGISFTLFLKKLFSKSEHKGYKTDLPWFVSDPLLPKESSKYGE